jgi:signal transduction histidine kinase
MLAQDVGQDISHRLEDLEEIAPAIAANLEGDRLEPIRVILEQLYDYGGPYIQSTFVLDDQTHIVWTVPATPDLVGPQPAYYPNVVQSIHSGQPAVSGAISAPGGDGFMVSLSVPVLDPEGSTLGVLGTTLGPTSAFLRTLLAPVSLGETGFAQVINERGLIMAASDPDYDNNATPVTAHAERFTRLIEDKEDGVWTCHRCHEPAGEGARSQDVMAFAPLTTVPWGVAIRQDKDEAFGSRNDLRNKFVISGGVALGLALVGATLMARTLTRPLRRLALACQRIAGGNLEEPVAVGGRDEIGQLGSAFELMRQRLKQSRQDLEERSKALATLEERDRIAGEMHDSLSQVLSYIRLSASAIDERIASGDVTTARDKLEEVRQAARDAYEDVRQDIFALRARGTLEKGLLPALREFLNHYRAQTGLGVELNISDQRDIRLGEGAQVQLLRIIQEALANVRKHAKARAVAIQFSRDGGWVEVSVADDGQGFEPEQAGHQGYRFGLQMMKERAESLGGTLAVLSRLREGTRILVRLPVSNNSKE